MSLPRPLVLLAAALALGAGPAAAQGRGGAVVYVDADADGAETGASWADAFTGLQGALAPGADLAVTLAALVTPAELDATRARVAALLTDGRHPSPGGDWPPIPWPPV